MQVHLSTANVAASETSS